MANNEFANRGDMSGGGSPVPIWMEFVDRRDLKTDDERYPYTEVLGINPNAFELFEIVAREMTMDEGIEGEYKVNRVKPSAQGMNTETIRKRDSNRAAIMIYGSANLGAFNLIYSEARSAMFSDRDSQLSRLSKHDRQNFIKSVREQIAAAKMGDR